MWNAEKIFGHLYIVKLIDTFIHQLSLERSLAPPSDKASILMAS